MNWSHPLACGKQTFSELFVTTWSTCWSQETSRLDCSRVPCMTSKDSTNGVVGNLENKRCAAHSTTISLSSKHKYQSHPIDAFQRTSPAKLKLSMITLLTPLCSVGASVTATRKTLTHLNKLVRMALLRAAIPRYPNFFTLMQMRGAGKPPCLEQPVRLLVHGHKTCTLALTHLLQSNQLARPSEVHFSRGAWEAQKLQLPPKLKKGWSTYEPCDVRCTLAM